MKRVTVRDLRLHWPKVEKRLRSDKTLVITRDSEPVATLTVFEATDSPARPRFNAASHMKRLATMWAGLPPLRSSDSMLAEERGE